MTSSRTLWSLPALLVVLASCGSAQSPSDGPPSGGDDTIHYTQPPPPAEPSPPVPAPVADGRRCGTRGSESCAANEYCDFPDGSQCGATDVGGVCRTRPEICTREYRPVCGCDGQTHPTRCSAAAGGVDTASEGPCVAPALDQRNLVIES